MAHIIVEKSPSSEAMDYRSLPLKTVKTLLFTQVSVWPFWCVLNPDLPALQLHTQSSEGIARAEVGRVLEHCKAMDLILSTKRENNKNYS